MDLHGLDIPTLPSGLELGAALPQLERSWLQETPFSFSSNAKE